MELFDTLFTNLNDKQAARRVQVRIDRAEDGNFGDSEPVGEGVSEMLIHYGPGATNPPNPKTSKSHKKLRGNCRRL